MRQCAFLSMDSLDGYICYDHLLYAPMAEAGWQVTPVSWHRQNTDWGNFEAVIVRSTWDYQDDPEHFLQTLETIEHSPTRLENSLATIRTNINKRYLLDLEALGLPIIPSLFLPRLRFQDLTTSFARFATTEIIVKPEISANAAGTFRLSLDSPEMETAVKTLNSRECLIQPFVGDIIREGEYSLFFFGGQYSHTIRKSPKTGDFRVQEEHGGRLLLVDPEPLMLHLAKQIMEVLQPTPLYSRIDLVRYHDNFCIMELELIEPSLYFNMDPASPARFVNAFMRRIDNY